MGPVDRAALQDPRVLLVRLVLLDRLDQEDIVDTADIGT
jgi:hypothetical protein